MKVSESFYSVQGEGASVGVPAYFIRLSGCNLLCGGHMGSMVKDGRATWWCDSERIWKEFTEMSADNLLNKIQKEEQLHNIFNGNTHLIWTGGEPLLPQHQKDILDFFECFVEKVGPLNDVYNELETNGSLNTTEDFLSKMKQINCSPKLSNSGMPANVRINPSTIQMINNHEGGYFKFVLTCEKDMEEIIQTYINPFNIPKNKVIIMPGVDNRDDLSEMTRFIFEMTKKYGYRGISRQHILAWNKLCGV